MDNVSAHDNIADAYRDPLDSFTDREQIITLFEQLLSSAQAGKLRFLAVKGNSGTGKTFLISFLMKNICPRYTWQAGLLSVARSAEPDFRSLLAKVEDALKGCVPLQSLKRYRLKRDDYYRRFDEHCSAVTIGHVEQFLSAGNTASVSGITMNVQVTTELRRRELQLRSELTGALVELAEESERPLCLFIDNYEYLAEAESGLKDWLFSELLSRLAAATPYAVLIVTCGWTWPADAAIRPFTLCTRLDDFDLEQVQDYLERQGLFSHTSTATGPQALTSAFYALTRGHPLVLGLAVTYFQQLGERERTAHHLLQQKPLVDERARVEFLEERLLQRLPEPHRTLLERGPILRFVDQGTLQALLTASGDPSWQGGVLDDRAYSHFLGYPFIQQAEGSAYSPMQVRYCFHELVRQVRLAALRQHHQQTKERLHRTVVEYYEHFGLTIAGEATPDTTNSNTTSNERWMMQGELLYHALQVRELREAAFLTWVKLTEYALSRWDHQQAGMLIDLVRQLTEEGEVYFSKEDAPYCFYRIQLAHFLRQEAHWEEAKGELEQAALLFEQRGNATGLAQALQELGDFYLHQGKLDDALSSYERALHYFEQALRLREQIGVPADIANSLNTIGGVHDVRGEPGRALACYEQALKLREQIGNPIDIATSLNNIGIVYKTQGKLEQSLRCHERALHLREQIGNPIDIANSCNNIAHLYLERLGTTFLSHSHATPLQEKELLPTIESFKRALSIYEGLGQGFEPEVAHELEALAFCSILMHNMGQAVAYATRARSIREKLHQAAERRAIGGNMSEFFAFVIYPLLDRLTEKHAHMVFGRAQKSSRKRKKRRKSKR